ncbi:MAG: RagB/SusD family nutrient uptake outer membrane protein [Odoribacter sp.]
MKKMIYYIALAFLWGGCSNYLDDYSQDLVVAKTVSHLDEVMLGSGYLPTYELKEIVSGPVCWWLHVLDDDINTVIHFNAGPRLNWMDGSIFGYTTWQQEVGQNYKKTGTADDGGTWSTLYQHINSVNIVLAELDEVSQKNEQDRLDALRIKGECHFLRAQFYLLLSNLYANAYNPADATTKLGVPVKLTNYVEHDKDKESQFDRGTVANVYDQMVKDLKASVDYFTQSPQKKPYYRASKEAALLLLSRVYLYRQEWANAKQAASDFLTLKNGLRNFANIPDGDIAISEESPEIIFSQGSLNVQNAFSGDGGDLCISGDLYQMYDTMDYRRSLYFAKSVNSDSIGLARKYRMGTRRSKISDIFLLRTAEGYLNMAEACAMLGEDPSDWINQLRRMRIKGYKDVTLGSNAIEQVRAERRKELCLEGHRWFDLRRYAVCQKAPFKKVIDRTYALYNIDNKNLFLHAEIFRLEMDDPAYTFAIPKAVLKFDKDMPDNDREKREYTRQVFVDFNSETQN